MKKLVELREYELSQNWPQQSGQPQQPQYPQGYPPQGQYPQQYPAPYSPYQMPQVHPMAYASAQVQGLGWHFSRAGMMLIVLGALLGVCGLGCTGLGFGVSWDQIMAQAQQMDPSVQAMLTPERARSQLISSGLVSLVVGVVAVIVGVFVRRQKMVATIVGIVLVSLGILFLLLNMLGTLLMGAAMGPAVLLLGECMLVLMVVVAVWQLMWLIKAARSSSPLKAMQGQMQMQYWQMMQMQQQQYQQMMAAQQGLAAQQGQVPPQGQGTGDMGQGGERPEVSSQKPEDPSP